MERNLFILQRLSAMILAPLVFIHLGLILYAIRGGLSGAEILARTEGNFGWAAFYSLFVLAVSIHAPIGLRNILIEWTGLSTSRINIIALMIGMLFLLMGLRAMIAVI